MVPTEALVAAVAECPVSVERALVVRDMAAALVIPLQETLAVVAVALVLPVEARITASVGPAVRVMHQLFQALKRFTVPVVEADPTSLVRQAETLVPGPVLRVRLQLPMQLATAAVVAVETDTTAVATGAQVW